MNPVVSVIIPNYNHSRFLTRRIESVLNQTYTNFEIVLLDDASTDDSRSIIESYRGHPAVKKIIYNESNTGNTFEQWSRGFENTEGTYIWIAESDDWCEPSFLEALITGITADPDCVLSYSQACCIDDKENILWCSGFSAIGKYYQGNVYIDEYMLGTNSIFNASMAIWKKSTLAAIDPEYRTFRFCGDWLFWIEILKQGKVYVSGRTLSYFTMHSGDVTSRMQSSGQTFLEEIRLMKLLRARQWMTSLQFSGAVRNVYVEYMAKKSLLKESMVKAIEGELFESKTAKVIANYHYLQFRMLHLINKGLMRITGQRNPIVKKSI